MNWKKGVLLIVCSVFLVVMAASVFGLDCGSNLLIDCSSTAYSTNITCDANPKCTWDDFFEKCKLDAVELGCNNSLNESSCNNSYACGYTAGDVECYSCKWDTFPEIDICIFAYINTDIFLLKLSTTSVSLIDSVVSIPPPEISSYSFIKNVIVLRAVPVDVSMT